MGRTTVPSESVEKLKQQQEAREYGRETYAPNKFEQVHRILLSFYGHTNQMPDKVGFQISLSLDEITWYNNDTCHCVEIARVCLYPLYSVQLCLYNIREALNSIQSTLNVIHDSIDSSNSISWLITFGNGAQRLVLLYSRI